MLYAGLCRMEQPAQMAKQCTVVWYTPVGLEDPKCIMMDIAGWSSMSRWPAAGGMRTSTEDSTRWILTQDAPSSSPSPADRLQPTAIKPTCLSATTCMDSGAASQILFWADIVQLYTPWGFLGVCDRDLATRVFRQLIAVGVCLAWHCCLMRFCCK